MLIPAVLDVMIMLVATCIAGAGIHSSDGR